MQNSPSRPYSGLPFRSRNGVTEQRVARSTAFVVRVFLASAMGHDALTTSANEETRVPQGGTVHATCSTLQLLHRGIALWGAVW